MDLNLVLLFLLFALVNFFLDGEGMVVVFLVHNHLLSSHQANILVILITVVLL